MGQTESTQPNYQSDDIENTINELQKVTIGDNFMKEPIENIKEMLQKFNVTLKNFEDYEVIVNVHCELINLLNSLRVEGVCYETNGDSIFVLLDILKHLVNNVAFSKRIDFMENTLNSPNKMGILFCNIFTEESIIRRYRTLARNFHPDKIKCLNIPHEFKDKYINLGIKLFICVKDFKNNSLKLSEPSTNEAQRSHEEKGNEFWKIAIDFRNAQKQQWEKMKILERDKLKEISVDLLKDYSTHNGKLAYHEFRKACNLADSNKQLENQIKLRGYMALSQYISYNFLDAQLCALAAINLVIKNNTKLTRQDIDEAKKIFDKVRNGNPSGTDNTQLKTQIIPENSSYSSAHDSAKREGLVKKISFLEEKAITNQIKDDLEKISADLILKADRSLVRHIANEKDILQAKAYAKTCKSLGIATGVIGGALGLGIGATGVGLVLSDTVLTSVTIGTAMGTGLVGGGILGGVSLIILGIYCAYRFIKKGKQTYITPKIREDINGIMKRVITSYDDRDYQTFLDILFKENKPQNSERNKSLITIFKSLNSNYSIDHKVIIGVLSHYGFRPDGIAYLLLLIGEVLMSGHGILEGYTIEESRYKGREFMNGVLDQNLEDEANKLDKIVKTFGEKAWLSNCNNLYRKLIKNQDYKRIAEENKDAQNQKIFASKLNEIRNIAKINLAMAYVIEAEPDAVQKAKTFIEEVRNSTSIDNQLNEMANIRLELLVDLFYIISGEQIQNFSIEQ